MKTPSEDLRLYAIGEPRIVTRLGPIEPSAHVTFAAAVFLILEGRSPISRRTVEEVLWPTITSSQAAHRLRQTLLKLRRLGLDIQSVGKTQIKLGAPSVFLDFEEWSLDENARYPRPLELMPFGGYRPQISPEFSDWLDRQRAAITSVLSHAMLHRIAQHRLAGEWVAVESWCRSLLQIAPLNEEATLAHAEALAMRGAKYAATTVLDEYLREIGTDVSDLRVQVSLMRRRIVDRAAPRPNHSAENTLVGRQSTMERLGRMLHSAKNGESRVCLILGDAGIGKSRVLSELAQFAALQGFTPLRVNARSSHPHRPLSTFVELVPVLQSLPGAIGCSPETLRFLNLLTKHEPRRNSKTPESSDPAWIFNGVQTALFDLIDAVAHEAPVLIQLEDIHWIDRSSSDVLRELLHRLTDHRVFFALTARDIPEDWQSSPPARISFITLEPLDSAESAELIMGLLRQCGRTMEKTYLEWCVQAAEGNPYFLSELINHWIETGIEHQVPPSLSAVLRKRIARLDASALQVLQTCALLENNSTLPRIEAVLQHNAHDLLRNINSLGTAGMIVSEPVEATISDGERIASRHELLSNVALMHLTPPARRFLHRRIGQVLEAEIDAHFSAATLWDSAKHWQLAGDHRRAWHLATSCAAHLMKVGLPTAAAQAYAKCLAFCSTDDERLEVLSAQATAFYRMSSWVSLRETVTKIRALQRRLTPEASHHDDLELMDMRAQWQNLSWDSVLQQALACLHTADASASHRAEAGVMALMLLGFQGDRQAMTDAFGVIERLGNDMEVKEATKLQARMVFHTNSGKIEEGVAAAHHLVRELEAREDIADRFRAFCNAGVTCRVAGRFTEAAGFFGSALDVARKHNLQAAEQRVIPLIANMALETGDIDAAREWTRQLCAIPVDPSNRYAVLERQALAERIALCDGRATEARSLVPMTFAEAAVDPIHHRRTYNLALFVAAELSVNGTVESEAVKLLEESFARSRSGVHQAFSAFVLYAALKKSGKTKQAASILKDYRLKYRREPWPAPQHLLNTVMRTCGVA